MSPLPWTLESRGEPKIRAADGRLVCLVPRRADAERIAAALEALAVARLTVKAFEAIEAENDGDLTSVPDAVCDAADAARAALAKAGG